MAFKTELDAFFGKENWKVIKTSKKESWYDDYHLSIHTKTGTDCLFPKKYKEWTIETINNKNEIEEWTISNHGLIINHDNYKETGSERYTNKQALVKELMKISLKVAEKDVWNTVIRDVLPEKEANAVDVSFTYKGGNIKAYVYDELIKKEWFTAMSSNAKRYLLFNDVDFYLDVKIKTNELKKLNSKEYKHLLNQFEEIEEEFLREYGDNASFKIFFDREHCVEYINAVKQ